MMCAIIVVTYFLEAKLMYLSRGLYVFPNKHTIRRFMYDGEEETELPEITFEQQLIDFLEINLTPFNRLLDKLKAYTKENTTPDELLGVYRAIGYTAEIFCQEEPVYSFLLCTKLYVDSYDISSYEELFEHKDHAVEMLRDMVHAQNIFFTIADAYCRFEGTHEEKTTKAFLGRETIFKCQFEQVIAHTDVGTEMFQMTRPKLPYSGGYRFDNLPDYIWYIFLHAMEFDTGFSQCDYCGHFFKPKTKKKPRYCDRVRTDDGRTCKQIGPQQIYKFRLQHSELLADYDRAINRNYRRVERYELKLGYEKQGKDLSYNDYADWLRELHTAKMSFMSGEMSDEEFKEAYTSA